MPLKGQGLSQLVKNQAINHPVRASIRSEQPLPLRADSGNGCGTAAPVTAALYSDKRGRAKGHSSSFYHPP